jgi:hypothetical protein
MVHGFRNRCLAIRRNPYNLWKGFMVLPHGSQVQSLLSCY